MHRGVALIPLSVAMLFPYLFLQLSFANLPFNFAVMGITFTLLALAPILALNLEGWKWGLLSGAVLSLSVIFYDLLMVNLAIGAVILLPISMLSVSIGALNLKNRVSGPFFILLGIIIQVLARWVL